MFSTLFLLMVAPAVGSFLGALIDRLPREEDILRAPSRCRSCGTRLRAVDLVPLLSFVVLRGKCRYCAAPLPGWLPLMELAAFGLAGLAVLRGGDDWQIWTSAGVLWLLLALGVCDLLWFRLPDALTAALAALCIGAAVGTGLRVSGAACRIHVAPRARRVGAGRCQVDGGARRPDRPGPFAAAGAGGGPRCLAGNPDPAVGRWRSWWPAGRPCPAFWGRADGGGWRALADGKNPDLGADAPRALRQDR
jgi:hypothetical protein